MRVTEELFFEKMVNRWTKILNPKNQNSLYLSSLDFVRLRGMTWSRVGDTEERIVGGLNEVRLKSVEKNEYGEA